MGAFDGIWTPRQGIMPRKWYSSEYLTKVCPEGSLDQVIVQL